jgi:hypothetical protein
MDNAMLTIAVGKALASALAGNSVLTELDISDQAGYGHDDGPGFANELAAGISDNRALTSLHVGRNKIPEKEMGEIMAIAMRMDSMKILCGVPFKDKTLTELDVSGKKLGTEGALVVAEYLDGNRAISTFTFSGDYEDSEPVTMETSMVEADFGGKYLGASGTIMVAAFLFKCT